MDPHDDSTAVPRAWHEKAVGDLNAARACFESPSVPPWIAGFHLQQAAEKSLKGLLVLSGREPPRSHDLARLDYLLSEAGGSQPLSAKAIQALQPFAIEERYPVLSPTEIPRKELAPLIEAVSSLVEALGKFSRIA